MEEITKTQAKNPTFAYFGFGLCGLPDLRSCCFGTSSTSSCWCCWSCCVGDGGSVHGLGLVTSCVSLTLVLHCQLAPSSKMTSLEMISCLCSFQNWNARHFYLVLHGSLSGWIALWNFLSEWTIIDHKKKWHQWSIFIWEFASVLLLLPLGSWHNYPLFLLLTYYSR